jgi:hypothetical protein
MVFHVSEDCSGVAVVCAVMEVGPPVVWMLKNLFLFV